MRKTLLFLVFFLLAATLSQDVIAQGSAFKQKVKQMPVQGFQPSNITGTISGTGVQRYTSSGQSGQFQPRTLPAAALALQSLQLEKVIYDVNGQLIFTSGKIPGAIQLNLKAASQTEPCYQYLTAIKQALKVQDPASEFTLEKQQTDELGMTHFRMQQVYKGLPVWGAEAYLHTHGQYIDIYNGRVYPTPSVAGIIPSMPSGSAITAAVMHVSARTGFENLTPEQQSLLHYTQPVSELIIYHKDYKPENAKLAWHVTVRPNFLEVWEYFLDAQTGDIIHFYNNTKSDGDVQATGTDLNGVNQTFHAYLQGGTYYLVDASKSMYNAQSGEGVLQIYNASGAYPGGGNFNAAPVTSSNNSWEATAVSAMVNSSKTWDYFKNTHGRNSYNNQGASIPSIIHVGGPNGPGFDNAYWNGQAIFYGDGETEFKPLAGGLDVGAHEMGHAFEGAASNLEYQNQSGALAEAFADIAGSMVERQNWTIGEQVVKQQYFPSGCLRDMSNPHNGGSSLNDPGWQPANTSEMYTGSQDNGGVHINSGIVNFAYYKCATAISKDKAEKIFWRASFNYLTRTAQFADCRAACLQSAKDLFGDGSTEMNAVATAFDEVGISGSGGGGGGGGGGGAPGTLPVNPGQDYLLLTNTASGDPNSLYIGSTDGQNFSPISQTPLINRPCVLDDGSLAVFISADHKMRSITLANPPVEEIIQNDAVWDGVATHKHGSLLSAVSMYQDSSIYVYSFSKGEWVRFYLYNPGTQAGTGTFNVLYADAMDWDYTGQYIMYDAFSKVETGQGTSLEFWDVNFIKVWDNYNNNWGDGSIMKLFNGLPEGVSIGNPSFSKNSMSIAAFDMLDAGTNTDYIMALNLNDGSGGQVYQNGSMIGTPNYSKLDDKLIFTTPVSGRQDIAIVGMNPDKVTPSGNPSDFIMDAQWGIWFAQGTRPFAVEERVNDRLVKVYPNPAREKVIISIEKLNNETVNVAVFDLQGKQVLSQEVLSQGSLVNVDLSDLSTGLYFVHVQGKDFTVSRKVTVE